MNNETFGMTFQYAICIKYNLENEINIRRISKVALEEILNSRIIDGIFKEISPIEFLTLSRKNTSPYQKRCPHNFLLSNGETFSLKTFKSKNKMFAPKVVGQSGDETFNYFFGNLVDYRINRTNFKDFCLKKVHEILPVLIDYSLVSDTNVWIYFDDQGRLKHNLIKRDDLPELTFEHKDFTFTKETVEKWNETSTAKYRGKTIIEFQLHNNRKGYKIRLHRENFPQLLKIEQKLNNSLIGDSAELAICRNFDLDPGADNNRLTNNSRKTIVNAFQTHYKGNEGDLFPITPVKYGGTEKRERGGSSKSGVDFYLDGQKTLSLKTNMKKSYKVCPPEIGQPSPKTFDLYFSNKGWYKGEMDEQKFRELILDKTIVSQLLKEYLSHLNECDFLLWSLYDENIINSKLVEKDFFEDYEFDPEEISYTNDFIDKNSVTLKYKGCSLGEFQIHTARNSLKFRFHFNNLLSVTRDYRK